MMHVVAPSPNLGAAYHPIKCMTICALRITLFDMPPQAYAAGAMLKLVAEVQMEDGAIPNLSTSMLRRGERTDNINRAREDEHKVTAHKIQGDLEVCLILVTS
jgi:hypothetical protein